MEAFFITPEKAYAVALGGREDYDESAWSWSFDHELPEDEGDIGDVWNQLSLINTHISFLSDVAVSPDCNKTMLVSVNLGPEGEFLWWSPQEPFPYCDSVWLHAANLPEATEYSGKWIRTWSGQFHGFEIAPFYNELRGLIDHIFAPIGVSDDFRLKRGLLRLAPEETTGDTVYLFDHGNDQVYYNSLETLACWETGTSKVSRIVDLAVKDQDTIYVVGYDGKVSMSNDRGVFASWIKPVSSELDTGWTIAVRGDAILVGGRAGDVSFSAHIDAPFIRLDDVASDGYATAAFDSYFDDNRTIYAALAGAGSANGIYRWVLGESTNWTNLGAEPYDYTGLVLDHADGNPLTDPSTGGFLYASYITWIGDQILSGAVRCATPATGSCCGGDDWDYLTQGLTFSEAFVMTPQALKICGGLTPDTSSKLCAIDGQRYDMEKGRDGALWVFTLGEPVIVEDWLVNLTLTTDPYVGIVPGPGYDFAFGAKDGATEAYNEDEGDQIAPPDPIGDGINAYFYYPDNPEYQRSLITSVVGPAATIVWPLRVKSVNAPEGTEITLTWDAGDIGSVPAKYGTLELRDTAGNRLAYMRTESSFTFNLPSGATRNFHIVASEHVEFVYEMKAGWNMISLPLHTAETSPAQLLPGHVAIYTWNAAALTYSVPTELVPGQGYWVLYFDDVSMAIQGMPVEHYDLMDSVAGWHMIGSLAVDAHVTVIEGNVYFPFYRWNPEILTYEATNTLKPGRGYWLLGFTPFSIEAEP